MPRFSCIALLVGALVTLAAWGLERTGRLVGLPRRWAWVGALAFTVVLPLMLVMGPGPARDGRAGAAFPSAMAAAEPSRDFVPTMGWLAGAWQSVRGASAEIAARVRPWNSTATSALFAAESPASATAASWFASPVVPGPARFLRSPSLNRPHSWNGG